MKIEIWSDYVCPFCYIGERKLEQALKEMGVEESVEIEFKSFELNPNAEESYTESIDELIAKKYGMSLEQARFNNLRIIEAAKENGLTFNFEELKPTNTFKAHRLSFYAKEAGLQREYTEEIMKAYFTNSKLISEESVLLKIIEDLKLDRDRAKEILDSEMYTGDVREDEQQAYNLGIGGVPHFIFNQEYSISGAQPVEQFKAVLKKLTQ